MHLVADNKGWFNDEPTNIENMGEGNVKKVHDPVAIVKFLQTVFDKNSENENKEK